MSIRSRISRGIGFGALAIAHLGFVAQAEQPPAPPQQQVTQQQSGGSVKHQNRKRRRILPDEEIDLKPLQLAAEVSQQLRPRAVRRREEDLLA